MPTTNDPRNDTISEWLKMSEQKSQPSSGRTVSHSHLLAMLLVTQPAHAMTNMMGNCLLLIGVRFDKQIRRAKIGTRAKKV